MEQAHEMSGTLVRNLAALARVSPEVAGMVDRAGIPQGFSAVMGTDGTRTFSRIVGGEAAGARRVEWLGGTSMPRASAEAIVHGLDAGAGGANGLGLSIGTGYEWAAFLGRLSRTQMLYVFEPDAAFLRMALEVCDLSELIAERRVVILPAAAEAAAQWLTRFLAENPGFEPPTVLHPLATLTVSRRNEFLSAGELIVRRAVVSRQERVAAVQEKILALLAKRPGLKPAGMIAFLLTPRYGLERPIGAEAQAAGAKIVWMDRHDAASALLRLELLAGELDRAAGGQPETGGRILSDLYREQLGTIPPGVAIETWVPPMVGPGYWEKVPVAGMGAEDRVMVHGGAQVGMLEMRGIPRANIVVRALRPGPRLAAEPIAGLALRHRVAVVADLPRMDAATLGIHLPTHVAVFSAARELIADDALAAHPGMAADILRRSLLRAGVNPGTEDPALGSPMLRIVRDVLIPHLPVMVLARRLSEAQVPLLLLGDWSGSGEELKVDGMRSAPVEFAGYSSETWREVAVLAHLSPTGAVWPFVWEAVAAGVAIAAPEHASDAQAGSIVELLKPGEQFAHVAAARFIQSLKQLLRDANARERLTVAAQLRAERADQAGRSARSL